MKISAFEKKLGHAFRDPSLLERALTLCEEDRIRVEDLGLPEPGTAVGVGAAAGEAATLDDHLEDLDRQAILDALEKTRWNRTAAARKLGISFRQLRYRLEKLGL